MNSQESQSNIQLLSQQCSSIDKTNGICGKIKIEHSDIGLNEGMGVWIVGISKIVIENCKIHRTNNGFGIYFRNVNVSKIKDCKIYKNESGGVYLLSRQNFTTEMKKRGKNVKVSRQLTQSMSYFCLNPAQASRQQRPIDKNVKFIENPQFSIAQIESSQIIQNNLHGLQFHNWNGIVSIIRCAVNQNISDGIFCSSIDLQRRKNMFASAKIQGNFLADHLGVEQPSHSNEPQQILDQGQEKVLRMFMNKRTRYEQQLHPILINRRFKSKQQEATHDKLKEIDNILKLIDDAWPKFVQQEINQDFLQDLNSKAQKPNKEFQFTPRKKQGDEQQNEIVDILFAEQQTQKCIDQKIQSVVFQSIKGDMKTIILIQDSNIAQNQRNGVYYGEGDIYLGIENSGIMGNKKSCIQIEKKDVVENSNLKVFTIASSNNIRQRKNQAKLDGKIGGKWGRVELAQKKGSFIKVLSTHKNVSKKPSNNCCTPGKNNKVHVMNSDGTVAAAAAPSAKKKKNGSACTGGTCTVF